MKGDGSDTRCVWVGANLLAAASGESLVRMWDLQNEENYMLLLSGVTN